MTREELDEWSVGVVCGLYRVMTLGDYGRREYPEILAPYIRFALKVIQRHALPCPSEAVSFAKQWLRETAEGEKKDCSLVTNCHRPPRKRPGRTARQNRQKPRCVR